MYARKEAILSSQIEGTKATFSDLIKSEAGIEDDVPNDVKEIENYMKAIEYGFERIKTLPLSLRLLREIHTILMSDVRGEHKTPGEFRTSQNWIGGYSINSASYIPPSVEYLGACLDNFEKFMQYIAGAINDPEKFVKVGDVIHLKFDMDSSYNAIIISKIKGNMIHFTVSTDPHDEKSLSKFFNKNKNKLGEFYEKISINI